jgi:lipooligosaccharide transport system permease protein
MELALRTTDYWLTVFRRTWKGSVVTSFVVPFLTLAAMGLGLGSFVDDNSGQGGAGNAALGGVSYLAFIGPGLLAVTAMQTGVFEASYPVLAGFKWHKSYLAMAATPLRAVDIAGSQLVFLAFRILLPSVVFLVVLAMFGVVDSWWGAPLAVLAAMLLGMAHATPVAALSARLRSESAFALVFRLGVLPMSLFSGAFFPIDELPRGVEWVAYVTPIWHGVELCRGLMTGSVGGMGAVHVVYLAAVAALGWRWTVSGFATRLEQ